MWAKGDGIPVDEEALEARVKSAVGGKRGGSAGSSRQALAVINDGEMSKPSYATYVKDRLVGLRWRIDTKTTYFADLAMPTRSSADLVAANPGRRKRYGTRLQRADHGRRIPKQAAVIDMQNLKDAARQARCVEADLFERGVSGRRLDLLR